MSTSAKFASARGVEADKVLLFIKIASEEKKRLFQKLTDFQRLITEDFSPLLCTGYVTYKRPKTGPVGQVQHIRFV